MGNWLISITSKTEATETVRLTNLTSVCALMVIKSCILSVIWIALLHNLMPEPQKIPYQMQSFEQEACQLVLRTPMSVSD